MATLGMVACDRCGGAGGWVGWPGFTCYKCHGESKVLSKTYTPTEREKLNLKNAKARERAGAKRKAAAAERIARANDIKIRESLYADECDYCHAAFDVGAEIHILMIANPRIKIEADCIADWLLEQIQS